MARSIPPQRFPQLISAAVDVFVVHGFRQAQMEMVATALGVAKGTIYRYVESKQALLHAVLRYADGHEPLPDVAALPVKTPAPGAMASELGERIARVLDGLELAQAVRRKRVTDPRAELAEVIRDLYQRIHRNRRGIKVIDRCAREYPELAAVWFERARFGQVTMLANLLRQRGHDAQRTGVMDLNVAARTMLEIINVWAVNRYWDAAPQTVDEEILEDAVVAMCVNAVTGST